MRVLIDTNIITHILREREPVLSRFTDALDSDDVFVSSDVVDYEVRRYLVLKDAKRQLARYESLSREWPPISLTRDDWRTAARLWAELHRAGRSIEDRDLLIAISALKEGATLVTNNTRHFEGLGVSLADWAVDSRAQ
jgi:predicted nucleic acid-binding protein